MAEKRECNCKGRKQGALIDCECSCKGCRNKGHCDVIITSGKRCRNCK